MFNWIGNCRPVGSANETEPLIAPPPPGGLKHYVLFRNGSRLAGELTGKQLALTVLLPKAGAAGGIDGVHDARDERL